MPETFGVFNLLLIIHIYTITTIVLSIGIIYTITKALSKSSKFPRFSNKTK
jgi:hypothetical protein